MTTATKPSRRQREGLLGLFIVATIALVVGVVVWVENIAFNANRYRFQLAFGNAGGLSVGAAVRLRGVDVGRVVAIQPDLNQVLVMVEITNKNTIIPKNSRFRALSGGLVSQTFVDISPREDLDGAMIGAGPRSQDCDAQQIVCQGAQLEGQTSPTFDDLIQATATIVKQLDNSEFLDSLAALTKGLGGLTKDVKQVTQDARTSFKELQAAAQQVERSAVKVGTAADATTGLIRTNQRTIQTSLVRVNSTLDTAKSTFVAFRKVANDLDQITGDPQIREDLKRLIRGLGKFISLSEEMRWQLEQIAQESQGQGDLLQ
ncbi:Mammalian cell entry related domain-containing protein [Gloeomargarita lithophora Alchichica-D10]|uniref:Mammalian cell entry related domain-containing protein n=1 Tax=Gloeomargarita lithophora Alchichica-D10 TaxID=1188229 RepID=A0A1J0AC86_9CYAN|nr:MlaD family protein [Gloeomargarita lithophora]APB33536.1 Mammalian cell entry related domain-containing protein [Gloeomargarita lithophora Alchichica-D10]